MRRTFQPVLVEWDDQPFARKRFVVWATEPRSAGEFAQEWLDYIERVGVPADVDIELSPLDILLEESELEALWPDGGGSENLTGVRAKRMRDFLKLSGPWRRARILWTREPYKREFPPEVSVGPTSDGTELRAVVVVEGKSDQVAIEALAERRAVDLAAAGVRVECLGGAHRIGKFLEKFGAHGDDVRLAGLCDAGEEPVFRGALERAGFGSELTRAGMERLGFFVCVADLEEELIRALGAPQVEEILQAKEDLHRFRTLQQMPAWRDRATEKQLRRFMGSGGRRKIRYARFLVEALDLDHVPRPLDCVLATALR